MLPRRRRPVRRAGHDPLRHAERERASSEDTIAAFKGRTIHAFHTEGAGGGHAPDIIKVAGLPNVLPSSTNPTRPFTSNTHRRAPGHADGVPSPVAIDPGGPRLRGEPHPASETIAAEDILQDLGALSMMSSDSQAMGRVGEVIIRTWQTADKMKRQRGSLPGRAGRATTTCGSRRYVAKYTINPAIAHGVSKPHRLGRGRQARRPRGLERRPSSA